MAPARAAAYLGGGILLAAWLASAAGVARQPRPIAPPPRPADLVQLDSLATEVQSQATRLRERLAGSPELRAPARNPFVFAAREASPVRATSGRRETPPSVTPHEAVPMEPDLVLLGVAEEQTAEGLTRTAMIALSAGNGEELLMVTEGQPVAGRYRVGAVGADAVELKDLLTGATRRLVLRSPVSPL